jgi:hypothetical protein
VKDKHLMSVMFADASEFREQLLGDMIRRVRRKRRVRKAGQVLFALAFVGYGLWWTLPPRLDMTLPAGGGVHIVHSKPLPPDQLITTQAGSVTFVSTDRSTVALLEDDQLLEVVPGETKLLVWHAPGQAELVIVGP